MTPIQAHTITTAHLDAWTSLMVSDVAPFFMSAALAERMPSETLLLTHDEYKGLDVPLSFRDAYRDYRVHAEGAWVALLSSSAFDALPTALQSELLLAQAELERGQVYDLDAVQPFLEGRMDEPSVRSRIVDTPNGAKLVLDAPIWRALATDVQHQWLIQYVEKDQAPYAVIDPDTFAWDTITPQRQASVRAIADRYPLLSGANCFATALAAITTEPETCTIISNTWLHQGPFFRGLAARGYQRSDAQTDASLPHDAVLVWYDKAGVAQHACYVLDGIVALNKNAQQWFAPTHLVAVADLLAYWSDDPFEVVVYQHQE